MHREAMVNAPQGVSNIISCAKAAAVSAASRMKMDEFTRMENSVAKSSKLWGSVTAVGGRQKSRKLQRSLPRIQRLADQSGAAPNIL